MLEGLEHINWGDYNTFFGPATEVPKWLRQTLSRDDEEREIAWWRLSDLLCHQGGVADAAIIVTPFLAELLQASRVPDKESAAALLVSFATGNPWFAKVAPPLRASIGPAWETWTLLERSWWFQQQLDLTLSPYIPLLYPYMHYPSTVRAEVARALADFPEHHAASIPVLHDAIAREPQDEVRWIMEQSMRQLTNGQS